MFKFPNQPVAKGISMAETVKLSESKHWFFAHQEDATIIPLLTSPSVFNSPLPTVNKNA